MILSFRPKQIIHIFINQSNKTFFTNKADGNFLKTHSIRQIYFFNNILFNINYIEWEKAAGTAFSLNQRGQNENN